MRRCNGGAATDASHGSIGENFFRTISMLRKFRFEGTTLRSPRGAIHGRCDGFSKDQGDGAILGWHSAIGHLPHNLSSHTATVKLRYS